MSDPNGAYVTLAPARGQARLCSAPDLRTALGLARARAAPGAARLAVWTDAPPPPEGPDVVVCVPLSRFEDRRAQAEEVVAGWDAVWLLVESMPRGHRAAAHQHLVDAVSVALLAAAVEGVDEPGGEADEDVGF